jgi:hypothetical protein
MAKFAPPQITEINAIIEEIGKAIKPDSEIGARDKAILTGLLTANKIDKKPVVFKCKREYSNDIITFFTKEKGVKKSRFSAVAQTAIFVL